MAEVGPATNLRPEPSPPPRTAPTHPSPSRPSAAQLLPIAHGVYAAAHQCIPVREVYLSTS